MLRISTNQGLGAPSHHYHSNPSQPEWACTWVLMCTPIHTQTSSYVRFCQQLDFSCVTVTRGEQVTAILQWKAFFEFMHCRMWQESCRSGCNKQASFLKVLPWNNHLQSSWVLAEGTVLSLFEHLSNMFVHFFYFISYHKNTPHDCCCRLYSCTTTYFFSYFCFWFAHTHTHRLFVILSEFTSKNLLQNFTSLYMYVYR